MQQAKKKATLPVKLNVYDLVPQNHYVSWAGLGAFHSGVVLLDQEFSFGYHPGDATGVFSIKPGVIAGCVFRETIDLGEVEISGVELRNKIEKLSKAYPGNSYHLLKRNCNHFTDEFVRELTGEGIPTWVNRTSWWVASMECCIPSKYFPKSPSEEITSGNDGCHEHDCDCGGGWGAGQSLSEDSKGNYAPLPQDIIERRQMIDRQTAERLRRT